MPILTTTPAVHPGDTTDAEGFPIVTELAGIPEDGTWATIHFPGRPYATTVQVRRTPDAPGWIEITRDGKGDVLHIEATVARRRMAPVRINGNTTRTRTVAFVGFPTDAQPQVAWGLSWTLGSASADYYDLEIGALVALANFYII